MKDILIVTPAVLERPSCLEDEVIIVRLERWNIFGIKFKCNEGSEDFSEEKKSLLVGELVRKGNWFGKGNIYGALG